MVYVGGESGTDTKGGTGFIVELGGIARLALDEARMWLKATGRPAERDDWVIDWRSRDRVL